ncbi:endonuclease III [Candidatus Woesearchaeota archaeon]|nr:endonuclease III [Candidatus Woesearchaeota archaeon]
MEFITILKKAEKRFGSSSKRLAAEGWRKDWQVLVSTIMSAQSRDETTIPIAENLFKKYPTLKSLANARYNDVLKALKSLNYNKTKAKHIIEAAKMMERIGVPDTIEELVEIPGVGRKTANLVMTEVHNKHGICVDTHVHRISNVLGFVKTKTPDKTEKELKKTIPKRYWSRINRLFVLWGKQVPGKDKKKLLDALK